MPRRTKDTVSTVHLLTRVEFVQRIHVELVPFERDVNAICYLHINHLKRFNRMRGVERGDQVMKEVADYLLEVALDGLVARYAGDGFVFVIANEQADGIVSHIQVLLPEDGSVRLKARVGAIACRRPMSCPDCVERARFACETLSGRDANYRRFDEELAHVFDRRSYVIDHLDDAISRGEIEAWAQPIVRVLTGVVCEVEVLARWRSGAYGMLSPAEFIPPLEAHGLIHKLDLAVFRVACEQWRTLHELGPSVPFGINLSRLDFELCDIYANMRAIMSQYDVPPDQVHVEVTESSEASGEDGVYDGLRRFHNAGFKTYMDDFGTGYSSLGMLADLRFDVIKIDKTFIDHVETNERARSVLADTVCMVKRLGLQTLCEGVETEWQFDFLRSIGCEKAQGYYFSRPLPREEVLDTLARMIRHPEESEEDAYYDAIGQVSLLDGTSVATHGVEAASFKGRNPIALVEFNEQGVRMLNCNIAYSRLIRRMGFDTFEEFNTYTITDEPSVVARAAHAAERAEATGEEQQFDFMIGATYCSVSLRFVARMGERRTFLNLVASIDNAPQITDKTLLTGILANPDRKYFWKDRDRRFLGANEAFLDYYGFDGLGAILGKNDEDMGWHVDNDPFRNDELRVLRGEYIMAAHGICESRGELRKILATKRPLYSNGEIVGLVGYFEDVGLFEGDGTSW